MKKRQRSKTKQPDFVPYNYSFHTLATVVEWLSAEFPIPLKTDNKVNL